MNLLYALSGTILHIVLAIMLMLFGSHTVQSIVLFALLFGAVSQFLAQDGRVWVLHIALGMSYIGMGLAAVSVVVFALS